MIYVGSLVNPELLSYCKKECEIHNSAYMTLEEVLTVMEEAEKQKLTTVRLHTGGTEHLWSSARTDGSAG